jgi:hypothetical protein
MNCACLEEQAGKSGNPRIAFLDHMRILLENSGNTRIFLKYFATHARVVNT